MHAGGTEIDEAGNAALRLRTSSGVPVLDFVYVIATIALFALVALVARGVEKL